MTKQTIHEFLKSTRINRSLSIQGLAKSSGVSASHISRIERGERNPSPKTLEKLAPCLEIDYLTLLQIAKLVDKSQLQKINMEQVLEHPFVFFEGKVLSDEAKGQIRQILKK